MPIERRKVQIDEFPEDEKGGLVVSSRDGLNRALAFPLTARSIVIADEASLFKANEFRNGIRALKKEIDDSFDPQIDQANALHKSLLAEKRKFADPLDMADRIVKPKISDYLAEVERKRLEAARAKERAEAEARKIADDTADEANELINKGAIDEAEAIVDKATAKVENVLAAAPVIPERPKVEGFKERTIWYAEVTDLAALVAAVAAGKVQQAVLEANMPVLNKMASALHDQLSVPGVVAKSKKV